MPAKLHTIENDSLRLTVSEHGAEAVSLIDIATGKELLWCGDPSVWGRHAPILFPYTGKLTGGIMHAKGGVYSGKQHGFARDVEHTLVESTPSELTFELRDSAETMSLWPYSFCLRSVFRLEGRIVHHTLSVENPSDAPLRFGIGYHPAFAIPFDDQHTADDYEFRFDREESPLDIDSLPNGLVSGKCSFIARNTKTIPLTETLFDNDSFCMVGLRSSTLGIYERDTGRNITCNIEDFPYVLIWSTPTRPLRFVCIEPWHSLPGEENGSQNWDDRAAAATLEPGERWSTTLSTTFDL